MTPVNWRNLFEPQILKRGREYFKRGEVRDLTFDREGMYALVRGRKLYRVSVRMRGTGVAEMKCNCPYAEQGKRCKHMAAVLFEAERQEMNSTEPQPDPAEIVGRIPEGELRLFLANLARQSEELARYVILRYGDFVSDKMMVQMKDGIADVIGYFWNFGIYMDEQQLRSYAGAMMAILKVEVGSMIERGNYLPAFELSCEVFLQVGSHQMWNAEEVIRLVGVHCYNYWRIIAKKGGDPERLNIFEWMQQNKDNEDLMEFMREYIQNFLETEFGGYDLHLQLKWQREKKALAEKKAWVRRFRRLGLKGLHLPKGYYEFPPIPETGVRRKKEFH